MQVHARFQRKAGLKSFGGEPVPLNRFDSTRWAFSLEYFAQNAQVAFHRDGAISLSETFEHLFWKVID